MLSSVLAFSISSRRSSNPILLLPEKLPKFNSNCFSLPLSTIGLSKVRCKIDFSFMVVLSPEFNFSMLLEAIPITIKTPATISNMPAIKKPNMEANMNLKNCFIE